jgi:hypothetical protein
MKEWLLPTMHRSDELKCYFCPQFTILRADFDLFVSFKTYNFAAVHSLCLNKKLKGFQKLLTEALSSE